MPIQIKESLNVEYIINTPLAELSEQEWEALCDNCGRCCLVKLEDDETNEVFYTNVVCGLYDIEQGQCSHYLKRKEMVPGCVVIRQFSDEIYSQLPETCAYRLRYNNLPLPAWHPLLNGNTDKMEQEAITIKHRVVSEDGIHEDQFEEHIVDDIK